MSKTCHQKGKNWSRGEKRSWVSFAFMNGPHHDSKKTPVLTHS